MIDYLNNGKVLISSRYDENPLKPRYTEHDPDMLELQRWLIGDPYKLRFEYWCNVAYILFLCFVVLVIALRH
jgi:hypothetical protein